MGGRSHEVCTTPCPKSHFWIQFNSVPAVVPCLDIWGCCLRGETPRRSFRTRERSMPHVIQTRRWRGVVRGAALVASQRRGSAAPSLRTQPRLITSSAAHTWGQLHFRSPRAVPGLCEGMARAGVHVTRLFGSFTLQAGEYIMRSLPPIFRARVGPQVELLPRGSLPCVRSGLPAFAKGM